MQRFLVNTLTLVAFGLSLLGTVNQQQLSPEAQNDVDTGLTAAKQGDYKVAIRYFMAAQKTDPSAVQIWFDLGLASSKLPGYELRAIAWFKAYLLAKPDASNAAAIRSEITALEISYESRLGTLVDGLEPAVQFVAGKDEATKANRGHIGSSLASMRLRIGDVEGARKTSASFGITSPFLHSPDPESTDLLSYIQIARNGCTATLNGVAFDDTALDDYLSQLREFVTDSATTQYNIAPSLTSLDGIYECYRKLRGQYGRVGGVVVDTPMQGVNAYSIAVGPAGTVWITLGGADSIVSVDHGKVKMHDYAERTSFGAFGTAYYQNNDRWGSLFVALDRDGTPWFTEEDNRFVAGCCNIGRVNTDGTVTKFPLSTGRVNPRGITVGPDGNMWFTEYGFNKVGFMKSDGTFTDYDVPTKNGQPFFIVSGPDGNLWFTEEGGNKIGRVTTTGTFTEYAVPTEKAVPSGLAVQRDGTVWFAEYGANAIGKLANGTITEYKLPAEDSQPLSVVIASDGNVWFTEFGTGKIGMFTPDGSLTEYPLDPNSHPRVITNGVDGTLWFTEQSGLGRVSP